jgi:hypothetical protein
MNMEFKPVSSSAIEAVGYDDENRTLHVRFHSGSTYSYENVDPEEHRALIEADSVGAHFAKHIRPHYQGRKH